MKGKQVEHKKNDGYVYPTANWLGSYGQYIPTFLNKRETLLTSLPTQHDGVNKMESPSVYSINYKDCEQKYIGETGRTISTIIKEPQRLCREIDTERSEIAEHIAITGHTIDWPHMGTRTTVQQQ
ncbi:unnamed protein product [Protopolystoma xenopodis]|uniref:Uncharacterized protein n=1 Tax=Protopolystoma xenopodis TaxID=117903 RepID=A0A3S5A3X8_9PLAT|nr:unnamed protein product [Protopolystoma xenopodis]